MSSILGALFAILIGIIAIIPYLNYQTEALEKIRAANTASQFRQIIDATQLYVQDNYATLTCTGTTSCPIDLKTLKPNYLSNAVASTTPYNQTWKIEVLPSTDNSLQVLVFSSEGETISEPTEAMIAAETGQEAGFIPYPGQNNTNTQVNLPTVCDPTATINKNYKPYLAEAIGSYGHWSLPLPASYTGQFCPGHLVALLYFAPNGTQEDDYLYRAAVPGQPNLNTMQTDLNMGNNNLTNAASLKTLSQNSSNTTSTLSNNTQSSSTINSNSNTNNGSNQVVTATNSSQSSATISATNNTSSNNYISMTATNSQASALLSAAGTGGSNQISMTVTNNQAGLAVQGTSASLAVQGASSSKNYLTLISTQESPGTPCPGQVGNIAPDSDNSGTPVACIAPTPTGAASWQKMIDFASTGYIPPPQSGVAYASGFTTVSGGPEFVAVTCPQTQDNIEISIQSTTYRPLGQISGLGYASAIIPSGYEFQITTNPPSLLYYACSILTSQ